MFYDIVSNLSFSPSATSHLAYYWRRLKAEQLTRQLSIFMALALMGLQVATILAPPDPATASSSNDIIPGGIATSHPQQTLLSIYDTRADIRALFNHYGINRVDIDHTKHGTLNSSNHNIKSLGRNPHSALDKKVVIGGKTYYIRPLYTWGDNVTYKALEGRRHGDNKYFAILYNCGNLAITDETPTAPAPKPKPTPTPKPTPKPAPTPTPTKTLPAQNTQPPAPQPTPTPTPTPQPEGTPNISLSKSAILVTAEGQSVDANNATAKADETIEYTLTTTNSGTKTANDYVVTENVSDILEYADVTDTRGGILVDGNLTWNKTDIKPGQSFITTFTVRVKSPVPATPASISDPNSFDLKMDNVYGNLVSVNLGAPTPAKQVEVASATLPQTGPGLNTAIVLVLVCLISYFYFRNRQLVTEISILRNDHHGYGG